MLDFSFKREIKIMNLINRLIDMYMKHVKIEYGKYSYIESSPNEVSSNSNEED